MAYKNIIAGRARRRVLWRLNRKKNLAYKRAWYRKAFAKNPEKIRASRRKYAKPPSTPEERLKAAIRSRTWAVLMGRTKAGKILDVLGCTAEQLKLHIESQFRRGWTWADWGKLWELDHARPCHTFNLKVKAEQRKCFHFSNLRPIEKSINRAWKASELEAA